MDAVNISCVKQDAEIAHAIWAALEARQLDCRMTEQEDPSELKRWLRTESVSRANRVTLVLLSSRVQEGGLNHLATAVAAEGRSGTLIVCVGCGLAMQRQTAPAAARLAYLPVADPPSAADVDRIADAVREIASARDGKPRGGDGPIRIRGGRGRRRKVDASPAVQPMADKVHFSAFAPACVACEASFTLELWAFLESQRTEAMARARRGGRREEAGSKGPLKIQRGTDLTIRVNLPGFSLDNSTDTVLWDGEIANAAFRVTVPAGIAPGCHHGTASILSLGMQIARLSFEIEVAGAVDNVGPLATEEHPIRTVFASYASEDRIEVLKWKRAADTLGVDTFVDVLSLRTGQNWERELWQQVPSRDLFCLFWSEHARDSRWVEKEWRCALEARGIDYIHPVPLSDPHQVRPPRELARHLHFEDLTRIVLEYERVLRSGSPPGSRFSSL